MKSLSTHTPPHIPITAATLMQILKRAELAGKLCIAMAMRTGRNPFFIDRHCQSGYSECNACDIKRKESQGENQTHSNSQKSDRKSSRTRLEKVVLSTVLGLSVGSLLQLMRGEVCVDTTLIHGNTHTYWRCVLLSNDPKYVKRIEQHFGIFFACRR